MLKIANASLAACLAASLVACGGDDEPQDLDNDGYTLADGDCNDENASINPGATEPCDSVDNDCDGVIDNGHDADNDGFTTCGGDCRDNDPTSSPVQGEVVDGFDNDCDGIVDNNTDQYDDDGDGFSEDQGDCDDSAGTGPMIGPNAIEVSEDAEGMPEGFDNDCDGVIDEGLVPCPTERNIDDPQSYAYAIDVCNEVASASWYDQTTAEQRNILSEFGDAYVPNEGTDFIVLASGIAGDSSAANFDDWGSDLGVTISHPDPQPDPMDGCGFADEGTVNDYSELELKLDVPSNVNGFSFDFNFMSSEFPEFVCTSWDDTFLAYLESQSFTGNVSFDSNGNVVSINIGFFDVCAQDPFYPETANCTGEADLAGTGMDAGEGGGTGWLTTTAPVTPGEKITLTFMIFDEGDHIFDSVVLIDNFRWVLEPVDDPNTVERDPAPTIPAVGAPTGPIRARL